MKDLGVTFDEKLKFNIHIDNIAGKANRMLGFVMRMTKDFTNPKCIKSLFFTLVRPTLEYAAAIWNPFRITLSKNIEKIQRKFTRFLSFKTNTPYAAYEVRCSSFQMLSLEARRVKIEMSLLFKIVNNLLDTNLIENIRFHVPRVNARHILPFRLDNNRNRNRHEIDPIARMQKRFNSDFKHIDMHALTYKTFATSIETSLRQN